MRTSLAVKIFLSFWLIHALIFVVLGLLPDQGANSIGVEAARYSGQVATAILERDGAEACARYLRVVAERTLSRAALYDDRDLPACGVLPEPGDAEWRELLAQAGPDGVVRTIGGRKMSAVSVQGPSGRSYRAVWWLRPDAKETRPVPYGFLATAIIVSGVVCFLLARYLVLPLRRMRAATHRLREGDLTARAGPGLVRRTDEIGEVVRDFDTMAERIESLVGAQQQLLSDISHELRSPLARLNVALELARRTAGSGAEAHLARIESEAERMNDLVGRLLALARAETAGPNLPVEEFDLEEVVRQVSEDAEYEALRTGKRVELSATAKATLRGDPVLVASAVENVVRNAIRYAPPDSAVQVGVLAGDGRATVVVRDHGTGLPESELDRIFAPFHRVDASRDRQSGGTGLGLSIARRAVASQGGSIKAENAHGGGLQVTITLPTIQ
jgi:two-component system, OmpR family, sensor histidine kinase CpxA